MESRFSAGKTKARRLAERGSVSILAALIISAVTMTGLAAAAASSYRLQLLRLHRLAELQAEQILSMYDRELLERYGLWGYDPTDIPLKENTSDLISLLPGTSCSIKPLKPLSEPEIFKEQAVHFAKSRLPLRLGEEIYQRLKRIAEGGRSLNLLPLLEASEKVKNLLPDLSSAESLPQLPASLPPASRNIPSGHTGSAPAKTKGLPPYAENQAEDTKAEEKEEDKEEKEKEKAEKEEKDREEEIKREGESVWRVFSEEMKAFGAAHPEYAPSEGSLSGLVQSLFEKMDRALSFLDFELPAFMEDLIFQEYILHEFTSQVRGPGAGTEEGRNYRMLSGSLFSDYSVTEKYEAESIITGAKSGHMAKVMVNTLLFSTRLMLNYAEEISNERKMAVHEAKAAAVSAAVVFFSLGTIVLDPEALAMVFALLPALRNADKDVKRLLEGKGVPFYPDPSSFPSRIDIFYVDYLRIIALFRSTDKMAARAGLFVYLNTGVWGMSALEIKAGVPSGGSRNTYERLFEYARQGELKPGESDS